MVIFISQNHAKLTVPALKRHLWGFWNAQDHCLTLTWGGVRPSRRFRGFAPSCTSGTAIARSRRSHVSLRPCRAAHCTSPSCPHRVCTDTSKTGGKSSQQARMQGKMHVRVHACTSECPACQHASRDLPAACHRLLRRRKRATRPTRPYRTQNRRPAAPKPPNMRLQTHDSARRRSRCTRDEQRWPADDQGRDRTAQTSAQSTSEVGAITTV